MGLGVCHPRGLDTPLAPDPSRPWWGFERLDDGTVRAELSLGPFVFGDLRTEQDPDGLLRWVVRRSPDAVFFGDWLPLPDDTWPRVAEVRTLNPYRALQAARLVRSDAPPPPPRRLTPLLDEARARTGGAALLDVQIDGTPEPGRWTSRR